MPSIETLIAAAGSPTKLAKAAGVTTSTVRSWRAAGRVPPMRLRRLRRQLPAAFGSGGGGVALTDGTPLGEFPVPLSVSSPAASAQARDGKPRGVYAPQIEMPSPPPESPAAASDDDSDDAALGGPREALGRLTGNLPDWARHLTDRLGLPITAAKAITKGEAHLLRPTLISALTRLWELLDAGITHTNVRHAEAVIWQNTTDEQTEKMADLLLKRAQRSIGAAIMVRALNDAYDRYEVYMVLGMNSYRSIQHYILNGGFTVAYAAELVGMR